MNIGRITLGTVLFLLSAFREHLPDPAMPEVWMRGIGLLLVALAATEGREPRRDINANGVGTGLK